MRKDLLSTLAYFDIFHYPLTAEELFVYSGGVFEKLKLEAALSELVREQIIFKTGPFYSLHPGTQLSERRIKSNNAAIPQLRLATKVAKLLSLFPYVRGVAISGSLSKNCADDASDIDLFIITSKGRLWIARTILCLFRKIFIPFRKTHWFCMNYFVDEAGIEIVEKNYYTAIEIATLIPMRGIRTFDAFFTANAWTRDYFPNYVVNNQYIRESNGGVIKRMVENFFNQPLFNQIENRLMRITEKRWKDKTDRRELNKRGILLSMAVSEHFAKQDPKNFQFVLLEKYERKLRDLLAKSVEKDAVL